MAQRRKKAPTHKPIVAKIVSDLDIRNET